MLPITRLAMLMLVLCSFAFGGLCIAFAFNGLMPQAWLTATCLIFPIYGMLDLTKDFV